MALDRRRRESAAFVLPFIGVALIVPPVLSVFQTGNRLFGIPVGIVYLFAVWLALVLITAWLSTKLGAKSGNRDKAPDAP